jgi:GNAT superfamily N-acetyltransferase
MLAVDPAFGRRGLGARLLKWGLDRADGERVITFISSSPTGRGLYEKHGCRALNNYQVIPGYRETSMVRPVHGLSRG